MAPNLRGALLSLAAFGIYATHDVVVKFLGSDYSAVQIIFFSGLLSFPLVSVMLLGDKLDGNLMPRHPWWSALRAIAATVTGLMGFYAFSKLPLAQCYAIFFAMPLLITLMAIPMLGEKVGLRRGLAVVVGLLGVLVVLRPGQADFGSNAFVYAEASGPKQPTGFVGCTVSGVSTPMRRIFSWPLANFTVTVSPSATETTVPCTRPSASG